MYKKYKLVIRINNHNFKIFGPFSFIILLFAFYYFSFLYLKDYITKITYGLKKFKT